MKKTLITFVLLLTLWQIIASLGVINPMFLASPIEMIKSGYIMITQNSILFDFLYSFKRILFGTVLAILVGIPIGLLIGFNKKIYKYFEGILDFFRSIPPVLLFPLFLIVFGTGEEPRVAVVFFGCISIMIFNVSEAAGNISDIRINTAKLMGAKWYQILLRIVLFDSLPQIFVGIRVAISMGVIITIVTEMLVGTKYGLGSEAIYAQMAYNTSQMFFIIFFVGLIGMFTNRFLLTLEKKVVHWKNIG